MTAIDPLDEQKAVRLRQRLWGAAVLIALLVIFLPLLLDGSGSESQYRRVERLRAEPPRILDEDGIPETLVMTAETPKETLTGSTESISEFGTPETDKSKNSGLLVDLFNSDAPAVLPADSVSPGTTEAIRIAEARKAQVIAPQQRATRNKSSETLSAYVVQAGSFGDEANALAVRDKLRRAGFPSFVTPTESGTPLYRVRVGPMINLQQAEANRNKVMRLLDREAIVVSYP